MIQEYLLMSLKNLRKRKLRTALTMLGIFISIATIFMLVSLSLGLQNAVQEQFQILGTDKFFILPSTGFLGPPGSVGGTILTEKDVEVVSKVQGVKDYSYATVANAKVEYGNQINYMMVIGVPLDHTELFFSSGALKVMEGRSIKKGDQNDLLLGYDFSTDKVFERPVKVGSKLTINDEDFKVRGIMERVGNPSDDSNMIMPLETLRELFNISTRVDEILVQVQPGENVTEVANRVEEKLRKSRGQTEKTQDFEVSTPEELLGSFQDILNIITIFLAGVAGISLLVGAIGIANTMYTSVLERTKEIGVMKAIGAQNKDILIIFLIESGLLGLIGAGIGVCLGYSISKLIEYIAINQLNTTLLQTASPLYLTLGCLAFGFLIGAVSGVLPALQASRTNVVDALRYE